MPQGFLRAYDSVRARVLGVVGEVLTGPEDSWRVFVTGHSLGGALATLCSYELANRRCACLRHSPRCTTAATRPSCRHGMG